MAVRFARDPATGTLAAVPKVAAGALAAPGAAPAPYFAPLPGDFSFSIEGTFTGSIQLERSTNGGTTWLPVSASPGGPAAAWTAPGIAILSEPEGIALYRPRATAMSGTARWRLGQAA